jgi:DnaJ-class molecular chaperone
MSKQTYCFSCRSGGFTLIEQTCLSCLGRGYILTFGGQIVCDKCYGKGTITTPVRNQCYRCSGTGTIAY